DAVAHLRSILGKESDVVDRARAGRALRVLLQEELVANLVWRLPGEVHAGLAVHFQPVAREAEIRPLAVHLHAEHAAVEVLGTLEILRDEQEVIQLGDRHGSLLSRYDFTHAAMATARLRRARLAGRGADLCALRGPAREGRRLGADAPGAGRD